MSVHFLDYSAIQVIPSPVSAWNNTGEEPERLTKAGRRAESLSNPSRRAVSTSPTSQGAASAPHASKPEPAFPPVLPNEESDQIRKEIERIKGGPYSAMPTPTTAATFGPADKGMTIENRTRYHLRVYFSGPVQRSIDVSPGTSRGVALTTGSYEVAAKAVGAPVVPFYGVQSYKENTHYWLGFYTQPAVP